MFSCAKQCRQFAAIRGSSSMSRYLLAQGELRVTPRNALGCFSRARETLGYGRKRRAAGSDTSSYPGQGQAAGRPKRRNSAQCRGEARTGRPVRWRRQAAVGPGSRGRRERMTGHATRPPGPREDAADQLPRGRTRRPVRGPRGALRAATMGQSRGRGRIRGERSGSAGMVGTQGRNRWTRGRHLNDVRPLAPPKRGAWVSRHSRQAECYVPE